MTKKEEISDLASLHDKGGVSVGLTKVISPFERKLDLTCAQYKKNNSTILQ